MQHDWRVRYKLLGVGFIVVVVIMAGVLFQRTKQAKKQIKPIKVGLVVYDGTDLFISSATKNILNNIEEIKKQTGFDMNLEIYDSKNSQELQNQQINQLISERYNVIIVNIVEREEASRIIDKGQNAGIPIIFFNREPVPQDMKKWEDIYYVGSSAISAGQLQGQILVDAIKKGLKVDKNGDGKLQYVMLEGEYGHQDAVLRTYHCLNTLEQNGFKMENLATDTGMWRKDQGKLKMEDWLGTFEDKIEVVLSNNDAMALGAIEALKEKGYFQQNKSIPVLGVDGIEEAREAIENGEMLGTVLNDSVEQAYCIVAKAYELTTRQKYQKPIVTQEEDRYFWVNHKKITKITPK